MSIVYIAIGIHNPGGMPALNGLDAEYNRILSWAKSLKPEGEVIVYEFNDFEGEKIDADAIRAEVDLVELANSEWVIVYFCGHGFNVSGDPVWVLDGTETEPESFINIAGLRSAIASHGAREITIIGDACQSLALDRKNSSAILKRGKKQDLNCHTDQIFAAIPGQAANIVHDELANLWKPVFTSVLADVLCGDPPPVSDIVFPQGTVVHNGTLDRYLSAQVVKKAGAVGLTQNALLLAGRVQPNNIYRQIAPFDVSQLPGLSEIIRPVTTPVFKRMSKILKEGAAGILAEKAAGASAGSLNDLLDAFTTGALSGTESPEVIKAKVAPKQPEWRAQKREQFEIDTNSEWRLAEWMQFLQVSENKPGLVYRRLESSNSFQIWPRDEGSDKFISLTGNSLIVDNSQESWSSVPYFRDLVCLISAQNRTKVGSGRAPDARFQAAGIYQLMWKSPDAPIEYQGAQNPEYLARYMKAFISGTLDTNTINVLVSELRFAKHFNPILGVIACYHYDRIGDVNAIRRTASYFPANNQPIPIDIALMCRLPLLFREGKILTISLPKVKAVKAPYPDAPRFLFEVRDAVKNAEVAGILPMMSAGWRLLDIQDGNSAFADLRDLLSPHLTPSPITSFIGGKDKFIRFLATQPQ